MLGYEISFDALTGNEEIILVRERNCHTVYICNWSGDELGSFSEMQFGLHLNEMIYKMHLGTNEILHLALRNMNNGECSKIVTFRVSFHLKYKITIFILVFSHTIYLCLPFALTFSCNNHLSCLQWFLVS